MRQTRKDCEFCHNARVVEQLFVYNAVVAKGVEPAYIDVGPGEAGVALWVMRWRKIM